MQGHDAEVPLPSRIRVFRANPMQWTPFADDDPPDAFKRVGVEFALHPLEADIILGLAARDLRPFGKMPKRFAIWTHEPRSDLHCRSPVRVPGVRQPVYVMNVHAGSLLTDNCHLMGEHKSPLDRDRCLRNFASKPFRAAILATYHRKRNPLRWYLKTRFSGVDPRTSLIQKADGSLLRDGRNVDLFQRRQALALYLQRMNFCDIYGRAWPRAVKISGESRFNDWETSKQAVLKNYAINLAFENTIVPHYVTEKIWDAIKAACLPVYHGTGNGIYDDFPQGSFIEAADKSVGSLAEEIMLMDLREACDRYEACLDVYQRVVREDRHQTSILSQDTRTAGFLATVMRQPAAFTS